MGTTAMTDHQITIKRTCAILQAVRAKHPETTPDPDRDYPLFHSDDEDELLPANKVGTIPCPTEQCGGTIRYAISSYNGHIRAQCDKGCCNVIQ